MPGKFIKILVEGKSFKNVTEAATFYNLKPKVVRDRIRADWSVEEALELVDREVRVYNGCLIQGKSFASITAAAKEFGVKPNIANKRLSDGWSIEEAMGLVQRGSRRKGNPKACTILGIEFESKAERNRYFGLSEKTPDLVEKRLARKWTELEAVGLEKRVSSKKKWKKSKIIVGKAYPHGEMGEFKLYCIRNKINGKKYIGITITDLKTRLRGHFAQAFSEEKSNNKFHNAIRKYGVDNFEISLIRKDARDFYELGKQEIEEIEKRKTIISGYNTSQGGDIGTATAIEINGVKFVSISSAADFYGIRPDNFAQRLRNGWSPEEAASSEGGRTQSFSVNGVSYKSFREACRAYNLKWQTIYARINAHGWTVDQAFELVDPPAKSKR